MSLSKGGAFGQFKWHFMIYIVLGAIIILTLLTDIFKTSQPGQIPQLVWLFGGILVLIAMITMLAKTISIHQAIEDNGQKLEKIDEAFAKIRAALGEINQNSRISEQAKAIACREADKHALREAVFDRFQQQDFEGTYKLIDEISRVDGYKELARQLRSDTDRYHHATDTERVSQVIAHIEKLLDNCEWVKASSQTERLIKAYPNSEESTAMRQRLIDKKQERKKILLNVWDDAVKRGATDRSLEILHELDQCLTPNEGLALQEAARSVFRNKLHSLGVQFSLAVSGKKWARAIEAGRQIMRDFPNSRMAEEIRGKMDTLKQKAWQQSE